MRTMTVGQFKADFSSVLASVAKGQPVAVAFGRKHKPVAMLVPFEIPKKNRKLGLLSGKAGYRWKGDGKISDEEMLGA
jgi:antitoxin (DNA-binding transcriptional repressor) of toxin-antitoxin stability system